MIDINEEIKKLNWSKEPKGLYEPIAYTLASGGKRLRPTLALLGCELFGGKAKDALPAALALEIYHNHTLLHDDVMDHSDTRRGRETVWKRWNENTAILSGDQMLIEAFKILGKTPSAKLPEVLRLFAKMATEICEGQQYDMDFENRDNVRIEDYLEMIRLKTSVLLATALQIGTLNSVANADATTAYLKAIVAARTNKESEAITQLRNALKLDPSLKGYAAKDIEFAAIMGDSSFQALVK